MVAKRAEKRFPSAYKKYVAGGNNMISYTIKVNGMMCSHCAARVEKAAMSVNGVADAKVNLDEKTVTVSGEETTRRAVRQAITDAGYEVE